MFADVYNRMVTNNSIEDVDYWKEENDRMTEQEIRMIAARSSIPYSEFMETFEDLITAGYDEDTAVKIIKESAGD